MLEYSTGIEDNLYKFNYISMRKRTTLLLKSFFRASLSLFFIFHTLAPSVLATGDLLSTQKESVSVETKDTEGEITKEAVSDPESIVKEGLPYRETKLPGPNLKNRGGQYSISSTSGIWTSVDGGDHVTGVNSGEIRWGKKDCIEKVCVEYGWFGICKKYEYQNRCSGLGFNGTAGQSFDADEKILLGDLTHFNWPTSGGANGAKLKITLNFTNPALTPSPTFTYDFKLEESTNRRPCPAYHDSSHAPCDDRVTFPNAYGEEVFTIGDTKYTLKIDGFQDKYPEGEHVAGFVTEENKNNKAYLVGHLSSVLIEKPSISLRKKVNGDDANNPTGPVVAEGDTVNFEYIVQNTGNVALSGIKVTDDKGVSVTCPDSTLAPGATMTCTGSAIAVAGQYKNTGIVTTTSHPSVSASDVAHYYGVKKINICHATDGVSHQYSKEEVNMTPNVQGHNDHGGDIIPPFSNDLVNYAGKNWDEYGQSIYNNDCKVPSGTLTVKKVVTPDSDTTSFDITGTGATSVAGAPTFLDGNTGTISGTQSKTFTVYPGIYSVTEQLPEGWRQVSNTCTDVVIAKGESKECTITNTKEAKLTIVKIAYPGSDQEFTFTSNIPENNTFTLKDTKSSPDVNGSKTFNLADGTYSVSENDTEGWEKTSASCSNQNEISSIKLKHGDNVTCTFVNTKYGSISGHKLNDADGLADTTDDRTPVEGWTIFIDANGNGVLDDGEKKTTTGPDGKYSFTNLLPGTYTIAEVLTAGWIQLGGLSQSITITAGEDKENVDFVNVKYPTIQVIKNVDTNGDGTVDIENATDWQWKIDSETHNTGSAPIAKMPGKYTISEVQKPNYHVTSMVCTNNGVEIVKKVGESEEITLKSGDNVVCTFTNARNLGKLIIEKEVINDNGGSKKATDFSFQIGSETPIKFTQNGANELLGKNEYVRYAGLEYSITEVEANQEGYTTTYENCTNITVPYNGEVVCKIKNYDNKPSLTLVKEVKNDNGGELVATDWTLTATGPTTITGDGGATSGDNFEAGTYTLSEVGKPTVDVSGYKAGKWNCTNNVTVNENNQITLGLGQSTICTIVNDDIAPSLELVKVVDNKYGGNAQATSWTLVATGPTTIEGAGGATSDDNFKSGTYTLSEVGGVSGYEAGTWSCTNGVTVDANNGITLKTGQSTVCTITNTAKPVTIKVIKELYDYTGREILSNQEFPINLLDGDGRPVANGTIVTVDNPEDAKKFEGLNKGKYSVREVEMPDGYVSEGCHATGSEIVEANNGETIEFICKNRIVNPLLEIEKTNNTIGTPKHAGEQVLYTITVKAPKDDDDSSKYVLKNVVVNDLAPAGFAYDGGSWTAISSLRGNIAGVEPTYNGTDFAKWELGDMVEGEVITLTYTTTISPTQDPGVYPDVAWTKGLSLTDEEILGNLSTGADTPFVGTEVEVIALDEMEEGEVLGASTSMRLPNTGAKTYLTIGAIIAMLVGLFTIFNDDKKKKFALKGVILGVVALLLPTAIFAGYFAIEIETPKTPTKVGTYDIAFFAVNTEKKIVKVECFEDGVSFQTLDNVNSGKCKVSGKTGGTYKYYVEATDEDGTKKQSKEVTITVDLTKPSVVENYKKEGNVLKFKTANDGRTEKVEIFRSEKPSFIANASTFLAEVKCTSNTECTYEDKSAVAGKTYYYAIRAVDNIGNTSGFVSDEKVITVAEKTGTTTNVISTGNTTTASSTTTVTTEEDKSGTVAGESDTKDDSTKKSENGHSTTKSTESKTDVKSNTETESTNVFKKFWYLWLCGLLILIGGIYTYVKKADKEG